MASTYTELRQEIAEYLGRDDLTLLIPQFVQHAEARMNRELRIKAMEKETILKTSAGSRYVELPNRRTEGNWDVFLEMRDIRLNGRQIKNLEYLAPDKLPEKDKIGSPVAYTIVGKRLILYPTPDIEYQIELIYYAEVPPLGIAQPSNDVLLTASDLYLYGSLVQSSGYARSTAPLNLWEGLYSQAAQGLQSSDESGRFTSNIGARPIRSV